MVPIGSVVADKYRVDALLGEGAMGAVVAATHIELDKPVAIKLMKPSVAHAAGLDRFIHEARGVAKLRSAHTCQVTDFGRLPDGSPYIVMEMLDGETLEQYAERGRLPFGEVARYLLDVCEALDEAHAAGIVHRDLKPGNLFRVRKPNGTALLKVLDFGVSKFRRGPSAFETTDHAVIGTPAYMSPEQLRSSRDVDARSDIWALGVIMYQLLSGEMPFAADTFAELCTSILTTRVTAPTAVDAAAARIVLRCLESVPSERYASVADLAAALAPHADPTVPWRPSQQQRQIPIAPTPTLTTLGASAAESIAPPQRSRRPLMFAMLGSGLVIATVAVIAIGSGGKAVVPGTAPVDAAAAVVDVSAALPADAGAASPAVVHTVPEDAAVPDASIPTPTRRPSRIPSRPDRGPTPIDAGVPASVDAASPDDPINHRVTPLDPIQQRVKPQ